jgi:hypothetical protein
MQTILDKNNTNNILIKKIITNKNNIKGTRTPKASEIGLTQTKGEQIKSNKTPSTNLFAIHPIIAKIVAVISSVRLFLKSLFIKKNYVLYTSFT